MTLYTNIHYLKQLARTGQGPGSTAVDPNDDTKNTSINTAVNNALSNLDIIGTNKSLEKTIALLQSTDSVVNTIIGRFNILEERAKGLQTAFSLSTANAIDYAKSVDSLGTSFDVNKTRAKQYITEINKFIPGTANLINKTKNYKKELIESNDIMRDRLKISADEAIAMRKLTTFQNKELTPSLKKYSELATQFSKGEGGFSYQGGLQDFLGEIGTLNEDILAQFSNMGEKELMKTVLQAKQLNLTLGDLQTSGKGFLDIQKQTEASVKFQMFMGKRFETQTNKNIAASMAKATIEGDAAKQLEIINDVVKTHGDQLKTNFEARTAAATMLGLEEKQLMKILFRQKELKKINDDIKTDGFGDNTAIDRVFGTSDVSTIGDRVSRESAVDQAAAVTTSDASLDDLIKKIPDTFSKISEIITKPGGLAELAITGLTVSGEIKAATAIIGQIKTDAVGAVAKTDGKAVGGPVAAGSTYMVGELGPELFTPSSAGSITPNNQLSSGGSSQAIVDALKGIQFNVINKFDGDAILTSIAMAADNRLT